jgi:outer membrane protein
MNTTDRLPSCLPTTPSQPGRRASRACLVAAALLLAPALARAAEAGQAGAAPRPTPATNAVVGTAPTLPTRPLPLAECVDIAMQHNASVLKSQCDLEAAYGVVVQTRAIAFPKFQATGQYAYNDQLESLTVEGGAISFQKDQSWNTGLQLVQSIYEGGRIKAALKSAQLTKEQALLLHQTVLLDVVLLVRVAYYDVLLAEQQIIVEDASVKLLEKNLEDSTRRYNAGTVPQFNVLRAEVEVANEKPKLIRARNAYRINKNILAQLLGYRVPAGVWEDIPLQLTGKLEAEPYEIDLPAALSEALAKRPDLGVLSKEEGLRVEAIKSAKAGYYPSIQLFGGYGWRSSSFQNDLGFDVAGWNTGAQLTWTPFDGFLTKGKVQEAEALLRRTRTESEDKTRQIELEVRTAYSTFLEAKEVLESQKKVQQQAEEALRLAAARDQAGTGTQLDVLNAQTSLTQARTTQIQSLRDYLVAKARLERSTGRGMPSRPNQ